jgi:hypothetical protein
LAESARQPDPTRGGLACQPDGNLFAAEKGGSEAMMLAIVKRTLPALLALAAPAALAAEPVCSQSHAGARMCMAGEACTCTYDRGGQLTATPPGWRWSCSLLETCGERPPATIDNGQGGNGQGSNGQGSYPMVIEPNIQLPGPTGGRSGPSY